MKLRISTAGIVLCFLLAFQPWAFAQAPAQTATLRGSVVDPSGAVVPNAALSLVRGKKELHTTSNSDGNYAFHSLQPGSYTLTVMAKGFAPLTVADVVIAAGQTREVKLPLTIEVEHQQVTVAGESQGVSVSYVRDPFYNCSSSGCNPANYAAGGPMSGITDFTKVPVSSLNVIPHSRVDQNAIALLNLLPAPTNSDALLNNYYTVPPAPSYTNQYDLRIDEDLTQKDMIWGAFDHSYQNVASYQPFPGIAGGALNISPLDLEPHYELVLDYTHVFSPTFEKTT